MNARPSFKRPKSMFYMDVRLMNHKEDTYLRWKLEEIHRKYRLSLKLLYQERELILMDHKKLLHLRVCEPHATINNTMQTISEAKITTNNLHSIHHSRSAPAVRGTLSAKSLSCERDQESETRFSKSASPSALPQPAYTSRMAGFRRKAYNIEPFSILQLKEIALIDSIYQKELMSQEEQERQNKERLKQLHREKLQQKMQVFLRTLETL